MNVAGISAPTAPPLVPAVGRVQATGRAETHPQKQHEAENHTGLGTARRHVPEPPKIKPLSTAEVQVMLGAVPPEVLLERGSAGGRPGGFDAYA